MSLVFGVREIRGNYACFDVCQHLKRIKIMLVSGLLKNYRVLAGVMHGN